ncbi:MAG: chemotaxis protein CheW [Bacteroidales bacterium]
MKQKTETEASIGNPSKTEILRKRAAILARKPQIEADQGVVLSGLGFLLSDEHYIIDASFVSEVIPLREFASLPCCPSFILGIINLRGRIVSIINLKSFLNLPPKGITNLNKLIIVKYQQIEVGLLADEVTSQIPVFMEKLQASLPTLTEKQKEYLIGITADRSILIDIKKFLSANEIIVNEEV